MKHRRVLYLICLLVVLGVNIFYVEYQIYMLLVLMIVLPLTSWIMFMISYINLGMSLQVDSNIVTEGSSVRIKLVKKNMYIIVWSLGWLTKDIPNLGWLRLFSHSRQGDHLTK